MNLHRVFRINRSQAIVFTVPLSAAVFFFLASLGGIVLGGWVGVNGVNLLRTLRVAWANATALTFKRLFYLILNI